MTKTYKAETERLGGYPIALEEGAAAFLAGEDQSACPYPIETSPFTRKLWMDGWYSEQRKAIATEREG